GPQRQLLHPRGIEVSLETQLDLEGLLLDLVSGRLLFLLGIARMQTGGADQAHKSDKNPELIHCCFLLRTRCRAVTPITIEAIMPARKENPMHSHATRTFWRNPISCWRYGTAIARRGKLCG